MATPKVWNLRDKHKVTIPRDAVYCGRRSPYGNPFIAGTHGSREHVIKRFVEEVLPDLDVSKLRGKDLVCWCAPLPCHCDHILVKANPVDELPEGLYDGEDGRYYFHCIVCGQKTEWPLEPEEFEFGDSMNLCGGSPRCCP